jgi:hypothetical protein
MNVLKCFATTLLAASVLLAGCMSTPTGRLVTHLGLSVAVGQLCEKKPHYAPRIAAIAGEIEQATSDGTYSSVDAVIAAASELVDWEKLSPEEVGLVRDLLNAVGFELKQRMGSGELSNERLLSVSEIAGWIRASAEYRIQK